MKIIKSIFRLLTLCFVVAHGAVFADTITVTGSVLDAKTNEAIIEAHIFMLDPQTNKLTIPGTVTDIDGNFTLYSVPSDAMLHVSYVGYATQILPAMERMDIKLAFESEKLAEFGSTKDRKEAAKCHPKEQPLIKMGYWHKVGDKWICIPTECVTGYVRGSDIDGTLGKCDKTHGNKYETECLPECADESRFIAKGYYVQIGNNQECFPLDCTSGYQLDETSCRTCVKIPPDVSTVIPQRTPKKDDPDKPILDAIKKLNSFFNNVSKNADKWKTVNGEFNTARLVSDLTAGVVLGTVGGVVSGVVIKKNQIKKGFEALHCVIQGHPIRKP